MPVWYSKLTPISRSQIFTRNKYFIFTFTNLSVNSLTTCLPAPGMSRFIEPPTEKEVTTLLGAISVASRFIWIPFTPDVSADELSADRYLAAAIWLAERSDQDDLVATFRKFRLPPETLRTCKAYPPAQIRSGKIRDQFAVYLTRVVTRFNQHILDSFSVPTSSPATSVAPTSVSPFVLPATSPHVATSQCSDEISEGSTQLVDPSPIHEDKTPALSVFPASSPSVFSSQVGDRLPKFSGSTADRSPSAISPVFPASSPFVFSGQEGDRLPKFSGPSAASLVSTQPRGFLPADSSDQGRGPSELQRSDKVPGQLSRVVDHAIRYDDVINPSAPIFSFLAVRTDGSQFSFDLNSWPLVRLERAWRSYVHDHTDLHCLLGLSSFVNEILVPHTGPGNSIHFILSLYDGSTISMPASDIGILHLPQWPSFLRANLESFPQLGLFPPYPAPGSPPMLAVAPVSIHAAIYKDSSLTPLTARYICNFSRDMDEHWPNEWVLPPSPELFSTAVWQNFVAFTKPDLACLLFLAGGPDNVSRANPAATRDVPLAVTEHARDHLPLFAPNDLAYRTRRATEDLDCRRPFGPLGEPVLLAPAPVPEAPFRPFKKPKPKTSAFTRDAVAASKENPETNRAEILFGNTLFAESEPMDALHTLNMTDKFDPQPIRRAPRHMHAKDLPTPAAVLKVLRSLDDAIENRLPQIKSLIRGPISPHQVHNVAYASGYLSTAVQTQLLTMVKGAIDRLEAHRAGLRLFYSWLVGPRTRSPADADFAARPTSPDTDSDPDPDADGAARGHGSGGGRATLAAYPRPSTSPALGTPGGTSPSRDNHDSPAHLRALVTPPLADPYAPAQPPFESSPHDHRSREPTRASFASRTEFVNAHSTFSTMTTVDVPQVVKVISDGQKFAALVQGLSPQFVRFVDISVFPELEAAHAQLYAQGLVRSPPLPTLANCTFSDFVLILCDIVGPTNVAAFRNLFLATGSKLIRCSKPGVPSVADFTEILSSFVTLGILVHVLGNKLGRATSLTSDRSIEPSMVYAGGTAAISFPLMILSLLGPAIVPSLETLHAGCTKFPDLHLDPLRWRFSTDSVAYLAALKSLVLKESQGSRTHAFDNARYEVVQATGAPVAPPAPVPNPLLPVGTRSRLASLTADFDKLAPYLDPRSDGGVEYSPIGDYRCLNSIMPPKPRDTLLSAPTPEDLDRIESDLHAMRHRLFGISGSGSIPEGRTADGRRADRSYSDRDRDYSSRDYDDRSRASRSHAQSQSDRSRDARTSENTRFNGNSRVRIAPLEARPACYSWSKHSDCRKGTDCPFSHDSNTCLEYLRSQLSRVNPQDPGANIPSVPKPASPPASFPRGPSPSTLSALRPDFGDLDDPDRACVEDSFREEDDAPFLAAMARGGSLPASE